MNATWASVGSFASHWFAIGREGSSDQKYIRINRSMDVAFGVRYFDVHTGLNLLPDQYRLACERRVAADNTDESMAARDAGNADLFSNRDWRRDHLLVGYGDDEARLQRAIEMSLEDSAGTLVNTESNMITNDYEDYDLNIMFREPDERTIMREQQDREYREAEEIDRARETIAGPVDEEVVRRARIARFE